MRRSRLIYLLGILALPGITLGWWSKVPRSSAQNGPQTAKRTPPPAPTFYLVIHTLCDYKEIEVRGASNLPSGAIIVLQLADFNNDGWTEYGEQVHATLGEDGYFTAKIPLKQDPALPHNLIIVAEFRPIFYPNRHQPAKVLKVVGNHGENLDDLHNPQASGFSGFNTMLSTIARAPCGPK